MPSSNGTFKSAEINATNAATGLERLAEALNTLDNVIQVSNIDAVSTQLSSLAEACKSLQGKKLDNIALGIKELVKSFYHISTVDKTSVTRLETIISTLNGLGTAELGEGTSVKTLLSYVRSFAELIKALPVLSNIDPNSISKLSLVADAVKNVVKSFNSEDISENDSMTSLMRNLSSMINSLSRLPKAISAINKIDDKAMQSFIDKVKQLCDALAPLQKEFIPLLNLLNALPKSLNSSTRALGKFRSNATVFGRVINRIFSGAGIIYMFKKFTSTLSKCFRLSNDYIETLNLFSVSLGEHAKEAHNVAEAWNDLLGVDIEGALKMWSSMNSLLQGFGDGSEIWEQASYRMSQSLTQLAYDLASLYNMDFDTAFEKLQSGISGMSRPLRELGIDVSQTALKAIASAHGIEKSVENMTQAEKAQLRYLLIMDKTSEKILGVQGDLSKTLTTPGNAIRILKEQLVQLGRAIGEMITPILSELLPVVSSTVRLFTSLATVIAATLRNAFGYSQKTIEDFSSSVNNSGDDIAGVFDDAEDSISSASDALYGLINGIDKFTVLSKSDDSNNLGSVFNSIFDENSFKEYAAKFMGFFDKEGKTAVEQYDEYLSRVNDSTTDISSAIELVKESLNNVSPKLKDIAKIISVIIAMSIGKKLLSIPSKIAAFTASQKKLNSTFKLSTFLLQSLKNAINSIGLVTIIASISILIVKWKELDGVQKALLITIASLSTALMLLSNMSSIIKSIKAVKTAITTLLNAVKLGSPSLTLFAAAIGAIATAIVTFSSVSEKLSSFTRVLILMTSALFAAVAGFIAFRVAKDAALGSKINAVVTAAALTGSITMVTSSLLASKNKFFADGGYITPGATFIAGERGPEWVGRQGNTSTIINDTQMSDIMYDAVRDGVYDAMIASGSENKAVFEILFDTDKFIKVNATKIMKEAVNQRWEVSRR